MVLLNLRTHGARKEWNYQEFSTNVPLSKASSHARTQLQIEDMQTRNGIIIFHEGFRKVGAKYLHHFNAYFYNTYRETDLKVLHRLQDVTNNSFAKSNVSAQGFSQIKFVPSLPAHVFSKVVSFF